MKQALFFFMAVVTLISFSCKQHARLDSTIRPLHSAGEETTAPYFTQDNAGNPVLCYAEMDQTDSLYQLKYCTYNKEADAFGNAVVVAGSKGLSTAAESMGKVAFKGDGTVISVFGKRFEHEKNPFAGAIYVTSSTDQGKSWAKPGFLHSDTSHAYGRGFFDLARLKDGQLAAVWLDGRFGKSIKGSALFFAKTNGRGGFGMDKCLEKGTCECCRTDLLTDGSGNLHLAYRSILFPDQLMGKQVRDMVYRVSMDNGSTFSNAETIGKDNWAIEGCPHSGPSLAVRNKAVTAVWFTAAGTPGLYAASCSGDGKFRGRNLFSSSGRHPQMAFLPDGKMVVVSEEVVGTPPQMPAKMDHSAGAMGMNHAPAVASKIVLKIVPAGGGPQKTVEVTDGKQSDHHAVLSAFEDSVLIAWVRTDHGHSSICYSKIAL